MVAVTVVKGFRDLQEHVDRSQGETFQATEERAAYIDARLPGYVTYQTEEPDLTSLTLAELKELAEERGVELPKNAKKAKVIELIGG